jgi:hypothetical protein
MKKSFQFIIIFTLISLIANGCHSRSLKDFRQESEEITHSLIDQLHQIQNRDQLLASRVRLKRLFNELVNVMIASEEYRQTQFSKDIPPLSDNNHLLSDQLYQELNRIYAIDGCRQIIEKCQEEALNRLDAYEKKRAKKEEK